MDNGLSGAPSILHIPIPLTPSPHTPLFRLCTRLSVYLYCVILNRALFNLYITEGVFWKLGPFDDVMGEMGSP